MLTPSDPARYYYVSVGTLMDPRTAGVHIYTETALPEVIANPFSFPTTIILPDGMATQFTAADTDEALALYGAYRLWVDTPVRPDNDHKLVVGDLVVNTIDRRVERADTWVAYTADEINAYRTQLYHALRGEKERREALVNAHLSSGGDDGITVLEAILKASRDVSQALTEQFAAWVRANTALTPPTFTLTNGAFTTVLRQQPMLADLLDIRTAFGALLNQLASFTLMSELITFEPEITSDLNWP